MNHDFKQDSYGHLYCSVCGQANDTVFDCIELPKGFKVVCECGSEKVGSPRHSDWCPKYKEENL